MYFNESKMRVIGVVTRNYEERRYLCWCVSSGHNLSQADATSFEGEPPATTGCYKQYEHSISNNLPQSADPNQVKLNYNNLCATSFNS